MQGHAVTLTFKEATPNVAYNTSTQYGHHFCEIYLKSDFKKRFLLHGHAVTLTFKVVTQMLSATQRLHMVVIFVK